MRKLAGATVLICGMKGLGAEIAKNVILAGVKAVTIQDASACELADLGAQFYLTEADVGKNRAEACAAKLQELNPAVAVTANTGEITDDLCKQHTVSPAEISEIPNDGGAVVTDTSGVVPTGLTTLRLGRNGVDAQFLNGHIKSIQYYPRRLSNAQLQELTT